MGVFAGYRETALYSHFGRPSRREDARQTSLATTAKKGELADALGVAEVTHGAHGEPEDSMPERELLELPMSATARSVASASTPEYFPKEFGGIG